MFPVHSLTNFRFWTNYGPQTGSRLSPGSFPEPPGIEKSLLGCKGRQTVDNRLLTKVGQQKCAHGEPVVPAQPTAGAESFGGQKFTMAMCGAKMTKCCSQLGRGIAE